MSNRPDKSAFSALELSALSLNELREIESQTIDLVLQDADSLDAIGSNLLRATDIIGFNCIANTLRERMRFLALVDKEIGKRYFLDLANFLQMTQPLCRL